jgi:MFS family permease
MNRVKASILLISTLTVMAGATISPSLPQMAETFKDVPNAVFLSKLILTLPALFIAVFSPLFGWVIDTYGRLKLLYVLMVTYAIGGVSGYFLDDIYLILAGRALLGISVAGIMTVSVTLIGDYYQGKEREQLMGWQGAFMAFGGVVFLSIGGLLADISWRFPFLLYISSIIFLVSVYFFLYEPNRRKQRNQLLRTLFQLPLQVYMIYFTGFMIMLLFYMLPIHIPFRIKELGIEGNSSTGFALALSILGATLSSIMYGRVKLRFSYEQVFILTFMLMGSGYFFIARVETYNALLAAMFIAGLGAGMTMPNVSTWLLSTVDEKFRGSAVGFLSTALFSGQFFSPILTEPIINITSLKMTFLIGSSIYGVLVLFFLVQSLHYRKRSKL